MMDDPDAYAVVITTATQTLVKSLLPKAPLAATPPPRVVLIDKFPLADLAG